MRTSSSGSSSVKMPSTTSVNSSASTKRRGSESTAAASTSEPSSKNSTNAAVTAAATAAAIGAAATVINGKLKAESLQADREAFLSAFEKPTQIYRYVRSRMIHSPIFLHRNLAYMKHRMSRTHKSRKNFKTADMLDKVNAKLELERKEKCCTKINAKNFYNIVLVGLFDPDHNWSPDTKAKVELQIARICLKKRKEVRTPIMKAFEGVCDVRVLKDSTNTYSPSKVPNTTSQNKCPVISVPSDCFNLVNGHVVRSYVLMVKVSIAKSALVKASGSSFPFSASSEGNKNIENGGCGFRTHSPTKTSSQLQVSRKSASVALQRIQRPSTSTGGKFDVTDLNPKVVIKQEDDSSEPKVKRRRSAPAPRDTEQFIYSNICGSMSDGSDDNIVFMGQVTIYDKQMSITLGNADYDLVLSRSLKRRSSFSLSRLVKREVAWEILDSVRFDESISNHPKVQIVGTGKAKLKVAIRTSPTPLGQFVDHPASIFSPYSSNGGVGTGEETSKKPPLRVIYQFQYNNNSRQQTEARDDLRCPWCSLNCFTLYSLLKHLKLCHTRFRFAYVPVPDGARVDVSINESFDGSYTGSAYDLVAQPPGEAFARNGPTKRTKVFSLIVCKPEKVKPSLQEFLESEEKDSDQRRSYITGHNRLYHHTTTCLPIHPKEIDVDSEGEQDPEWLQMKTSMMIDEFTDVNEGEKELMKMWNLHVLKHNYVGDCQIPLACEKFVEYQGKELIRKNLYRNFVLHLTNLFDFGLLSPHGMYMTIQKLQTQMKENNTASSLRESWRAHIHSHGTEPSFILKAERPPVSEFDHTIPAFRPNQNTASASSKKSCTTVMKTCA